MFHHSSFERIITWPALAGSHTLLQLCSVFQMQGWKSGVWTLEKAWSTSWPHGNQILEYQLISGYQGYKHWQSSQLIIPNFPSFGVHDSERCVDGIHMLPVRWILGGFLALMSWCQATQTGLLSQPSSPKISQDVSLSWLWKGSLTYDSWVLRFQERQRQETGRDAQYCPNCQVDLPRLGCAKQLGL